MSRTYRRARAKDQYLIKGRYGVLSDSVRIEDTYGWLECWIDPKSEEGKRRVSMFKSDASHHWMDYRGPSWFMTMFSQAPYRARAKNEIFKWVQNPDYEICLERKPHRDYWL